MKNEKDGQPNLWLPSWGLILVVACLWLAGAGFESWASMPVHSWGGYMYSDNGDVIGMVEYASPTNWDKLMNNSKWQEWERTKPEGIK